MTLFEDVEDKFHELEDGRYLVRIEGFYREKTKNGLRPIRWDLALVNDVKGNLPTKFTHVETDGGFRILMEEIKRLGYERPKTPRELEAIMNDLRGCYIEVGLFTTDEREGYRDVRFLRKMG